MKYFALMILLSGAPQLQAAIPVEQALELCRTEQNALRRLNCYDAIEVGTATSSVFSSTIQQQQATNDTQTSIQQAAKAENIFGLENKKSEEQSVEKLEMTVKTVSTDNLKKLVVEFTNGQVWRQYGNEYYQVKVGETHYVRRGALGSFLLGNDRNNRTIRVKREK